MKKYPSIKQVLKLEVFIVITTVLIVLSAMIINQNTVLFNDPVVELLSQFGPLLLASIVYLKRRKITNNDAYYVPNKKISLPVWLLIIGVLLLMIVVMEPVNGLIPVPDWFNELMGKVISKNYYSFSSVVILAPAFEELIYRGVILDGFLKRYNPMKAIFLSSLIFGLAHLNPWQLIDAFVGGMYIGWIYYRTQSIIACMVIHAVNNLVAFLIHVYGYESVLIRNESMPWYFLAIAVSGVLLYYGILILNKRFTLRMNTDIIEK